MDDNQLSDEIPHGVVLMNQLLQSDLFGVPLLVTCYRPNYGTNQDWRKERSRTEEPGRGFVGCFGVSRDWLRMVLGFRQTWNIHREHHMEHRRGGRCPSITCQVALGWCGAELRAELQLATSDWGS